MGVTSLGWLGPTLCPQHHQQGIPCLGAEVLDAGDHRPTVDLTGAGALPLPPWLPAGDSEVCVHSRVALAEKDCPTAPRVQSSASSAGDCTCCP